MLTAHLPSGYVLGRLLPSRIPYLMPAALIGSVFPDLDMIWFHLIDDRAFHHHRYWVHIPAFWAAVAHVALPLAWWLDWLRTALVFFAAILMHLILDTIGGGVMWAAPFSDHLHELVTVPATYDHWVTNFVLHWTFLAELAIWIAALTLWLTRPRAEQTT
jgi:inner membrane protein